MYLERTAFNGALASSEKNKNIKHGVLEQLFFIIRFLRVAQKPLHDKSVLQMTSSIGAMVMTILYPAPAMWLLIDFYKKLLI